MSATDAFWAAPPVSRTLVAGVVLVSLTVYGRLFDVYKIAFIPPLLYKTFPPQLWRLVTPFLLTGPQFNMIMDPVFMWQYSSNLELQSPRFARKGDYFVYIVFVMSLILAVGRTVLTSTLQLVSGLGLGNFIFLDALLMALAWTFAQDNPHSQQTFYILTFPTRYLPLIMLAITWVMSSGNMRAVYSQAVGIPAAHAYDFLTRIWPTFGGGRNWIELLTPQLIRNAFGDGDARGSQMSGTGGFMFRRGQQPAASGAASGSGSSSGGGGSGGGSGGASGGWTSGSSWGSRGSGRRLG